MPSPYSVFLVTVPDEDTARKVSDALLEEKLAACVNQVPHVASRYWWESRIEEAREILLLIKSRSALSPEIVQCVREHHPYSVPEIVALSIEDGHAAYLDWVGANTLFKSAQDGAP